MKQSPDAIIMSARAPVARCAYCLQPSEKEHAIHRDGFGDGPEVWLCNEHGQHPVPTCESIWARIAGAALPPECFLVTP